MERPSTIGVTVKRLNGHLRVEVADDWVGLPGHQAGAATFGRNLVKSLSRQLQAKTSWHDAQPGTRIEIDLPIDQDRAKAC